MLAFDSRKTLVSRLILVALCACLVANFAQALPNGGGKSQSTTISSDGGLSSNIVIDSLEFVDGQGSSQESDRNHYEPASEAIVQAAKLKPEPRSQNEAEQIDKNDQQQVDQVRQIQVEPTIIDHRPSGESQQDYLPTTSTQSPLTTTTSTTVASVTPSVIGLQNQERSSQGQQQQQQQSFASPSQGASWFQQPQQQTYLQIQQPQAAASNQPVQQQPQQQHHYPNSINSIINEHNQQQQQQVANSGQQQQPAQLVSLNSNGQPTSVLLLASPNGVQPAPGTTNGPRRISLSGWLRQISSMLANIFNRREHGTLVTGTGGQWIQLGPNAPHWLSQAQNFLQTQQQQGQQLLSSASANTRYYVQAPPPAGLQALLPIVQSSQPQQQQQTGVVVGTQQQQQSSQPTTGASGTSSGQYAVGDLQMSGSAQSGNYVTVAYQQPPATGAASSKAQQVSSSTWPSALKASARTQISAPTIGSQTSQVAAVSSGASSHSIGGIGPAAPLSSLANQNLPLAHYM